MRSEVIAHGISMRSAKKVRLSSENAPFTRLPGGNPCHAPKPAASLPQTEPVGTQGRGEGRSWNKGAENLTRSSCQAEIPKGMRPSGWPRLSGKDTWKFYSKAVS